MLRNILTLLSILLVLILINHQILIRQETEETRENAKIIESVLVENFEQTEKFLTFVGQKIAQETPNLDLETIHKIFLRYSATQANSSIFSWSLFDWVNFDCFQTVNTLLGVNTSNPANMSDRFYTLRGREKWTLLFSKPVLGSPSRIFVIPVGVQVETKTKPNAGTLVVGIHVKKLISLIEARIGKFSPFAIVDNRSKKFAFGSSPIMETFDRNLDSLPLQPKENDHVYTYSLQMDESKYPYTIFVGYDQKEFWTRVLSNSILQFAQVVAVAILFLVLRRKV